MNAQYSIQRLEELSGIKAHTIRIWEQRYGLLKPDRTATNIRSYNDDQLRELLNVASLVQAGHRISKVAELRGNQLEQELDKVSTIESGAPGEATVTQLVQAGLRFDEHRFTKVLGNYVIAVGLEKAYEEVMLPLLHRVGLLWGKGKMVPAQEHFVSHLVGRHLMHETHMLPLPKSASDRWLLFLPEDEHHELGLLFANYLLRAANRQVLYLGADVPYKTLLQAVDAYVPDKLLCFLVRHHRPDTVALLLTALLVDFNGPITVCCSEQTAKEITPTSQLSVISDVPKFKSQLTSDYDE